jgi:hypothetical protein
VEQSRNAIIERLGGKNQPKSAKRQTTVESITIKSGAAAELGGSQDQQESAPGQLYPAVLFGATPHAHSSGALHRREPQPTGVNSD